MLGVGFTRVLVGQDADARPGVVVERVAPAALDVWLDEVLVGAVVEAGVGDVRDQLLAGSHVIGDRLSAGLTLRLLHGCVDARVTDAVVVAQPDRGLGADEEVVEPVLGVVVVGPPAVTEEDVLLVLTVGHERRKVRALSVDMDAEVGLPLRLEVAGDRGVDGAGVEPVHQPNALGAVRVPGLEVRLCLGRVEDGGGITAIAEVAVQALADHAARRRLAGDTARTTGHVDQLGAVDGLTEGHAARLGDGIVDVARRGRERTGGEVEADPGGACAGNVDELALQRRVRLEVPDRVKWRVLVGRADAVEATVLVLGHLAALIGEDCGLDIGQVPGASSPPIGDVGEGQVVLGDVGRQLEGPGADRGRSIGPPRLVGVVGDDLLVNHVRSPEPELGEPVPGRRRELGDDGVRVGRAQTG